MDIGQAFAYINEDEEWVKKVGIGAIIGAVPFLNFAIFGYQAEIARNVANEVERPLPEWNELGKFFADGLRIVGAMFAYMLPILFMMMCMMAAIFIVLDPANQPSSFGSPGAPSPPPEFFAIYSLMFICIMPYMIFVYAIWPLLTIQIARESSFGANFRFSEMWELVRRQPINYLLIIVLFFGLYMAISLILIPAYLIVLIPCLGIIIYILLSGSALMLVFMVIGHLQGQFIREGRNLQKDPPVDLEDAAPDVID